MRTEQRRFALVVAGMHRSGTGAVARVLSILGCDVPRTLSAADSQDECGHWAAQSVIDLNDAILASAGSAWDDWQAFDPAWYDAPAAAEFRRRAQEILAEEFGDSRCFVLADPRICLLLDFWLAAVTDFGAHPVVVSPIRNPLDVAVSLETRDGRDSSIGHLRHLLWLRHVLDVERASRPLPRAFLRYEELLDNPHAVVARLGDALGIAWSRRPAYADVEIEIDERVSPALRHQEHTDAGLLESPGLSSWIRTSFTILDRWTRGDVRRTDTTALDTLRSAFEAAAPAFGRALAAGREAARQRDAAQVAVAERDATLAERDATLAERDATLAERDATLAERDATLTERDATLAERDATLAERDATLVAVYATLGERDATIEALQAALVERDGRIESLSGEIEWTATWVESLISSRTWRIGARLRGAKWTVQHALHPARSLAYRIVWTLFRRACRSRRGDAPTGAGWATWPTDSRSGWSAARRRSRSGRIRFSGNGSPADRAAGIPTRRSIPRRRPRRRTPSPATATTSPSIPAPRRCARR